MRKLLALFLMIAVLAIAVPASALQGAQPVEPLTPPPSAETGEMTDETPALWFVELTSPPAADGTGKAALAAEKAAFRAAARKSGLQYTERFSFDTLWNGLSIQVAPGQLAKLGRLPGVANLYPVQTIAMPETVPGEPDLFTALNMTGAAAVQSELGYTGEGIKVAVMDTGLDVDHPAFGGDGVARYDSPLFPSARVPVGYDFVGDAFNADSTSPYYNPVPVPDPNPDDCGGHGTHVAGIVGANDATNGMKGVAPDVTFGAYRVFGCAGSTTADIMIAAMERALADDMDILNMSIGSAFQWPQYPTGAAATRLVNKGVVVVASIGNSGANGLWSAGAPGLGTKVIGVASYDNSHVYVPYFTVNGQGVGYITMTYSPAPPTSGTWEIVDVGRNCNVDPALPDLTGKVALASRGTCSFAEKAIKAIAAGAEAVVVSNNVPGIVSGTLGAPLPNPKPVVGISLADGAFIRAQPAPVMMTWTDQLGSFPNPTGGLISSFSSYGLSPDLALKPDLGAPGGNIYSSYPLEKGGYATMGGTSMASPHVAGAAALLLQAKPKTPAQAVRGILQNSADPKMWWGNPGLGLLDNVNRQGAGMLQIDKAILATTKIEPAKIATGESEAGPYTERLGIENKGSEAVTYDLSYVNALSVANTFAPAFYTSDAVVTFSQDSVTVPAGGKAFVLATIEPATGPDKAQYGGYIVFTPQGGGQVYRVPFAGFVGDYQSIQVLAPTANGFPWLAYISGASYMRVTDEYPHTFTMTGSDYPVFLWHQDHQARLLRMELYGASGKSWHRIFNYDYVGRNSTSTSFFGEVWDGYTFIGRHWYLVPDGQYYAVMSVLKANGDANNPAHWETWTSPTITIDRP